MVSGPEASFVWLMGHTDVFAQVINACNTDNKNINVVHYSTEEQKTRDINQSLSPRGYRTAVISGRITITSWHPKGIPTVYSRV